MPWMTKTTTENENETENDHVWFFLCVLFFSWTACYGQHIVLFLDDGVCHFYILAVFGLALLLFAVVCLLLLSVIIIHNKKRKNKKRKNKKDG